MPVNSRFYVYADDGVPVQVFRLDPDHQQYRMDSAGDDVPVGNQVTDWLVEGNVNFYEVSKKYALQVLAGE